MSRLKAKGQRSRIKDPSLAEGFWGQEIRIYRWFFEIFESDFFGRGKAFYEKNDFFTKFDQRFSRSGNRVASLVFENFQMNFLRKNGFF